MAAQFLSVMLSVKKVAAQLLLVTLMVGQPVLGRKMAAQLLLVTLMMGQPVLGRKMAALPLLVTLSVKKMAV